MSIKKYTKRIKLCLTIYVAYVKVYTANTTSEVNTRMEGVVKFGAACMLAIGYLSIWFLPKAATEAAMKDRNHAKETLMQWLMCLMSIALAYLLSLLLHAEI